MRIAVAADEALPVLEVVVEHLRAAGHEVVAPAAILEWPEVGAWVAERVASGEVERGVALCWTGTGVSIAANKVAGIRAALCRDAETARGARRWNDANVLCLGMQSTTPDTARAALDTFLATAPDAESLAAIARVEFGGSALPE